MIAIARRIAIPQMFARLQLLSSAMLIGLGACVPAVGPDQVAVRFYPPPWKNSILQQRDEAVCTRTANSYVRIYVECMQRLGYRPEIVGQDGVHLSVSQLPLPPPPSPPSYERPNLSFPLPRYTPPAALNNQSEEGQPSQTAEPPLVQAPPPETSQQKLLTTAELEEKLINMGIEVAPEVALSCLGAPKGRRRKCAAEEMIAKIAVKAVMDRDIVRTVLCRHPAMLKRIPIPDLSTEYLACPGVL